MRCTHCSTANPESMRYCGMCGSPLPSAGGSGERERRRASIVFVDLMGFSTLTHGLDPEDLRDLADEVLTVVAGVVEDYDGHVDAFRGDGLIAVFGAPHSHPDDPYRAVVVAAAALRAIEAYGRSRGLDLHGRAGVTTGVVVAGSVGSGRVREYTVMGSVVNLASRLEVAARPGQVLVARDTYEATRHRLSFRRVDGLHLAGFPTVTSAYAFVAARERDADPYRQLPFVGREAELAALGEALAQVLETGHGEQLWLVGEAGSGKRRLLQEFARRTDGTTVRAVFLGTQRAHDGADGGPDWHGLAADVLAVRASDDERSRLLRAQEALRRYLPDEPRWQRLVLASLGLAPNTTWTRLERRTVDRTMLAWRDLLVAFAQAEPGRGLLVVCDSERYAPRLDEFARLLSLAAAPILMVRPSRQRDLPAGAAHVTLQPLSPGEGLRLLEQVVDPVFGVAIRALVEQVGGVPSSILELARALTITQDTNVSSSLVSLLQARLDGFAPTARRVLWVAALTGERCWEDLLVTIVPDAQTHLRPLCEADVLMREGESELAGHVEYRFQAELLRRAVLQMIPFGERPALHLRIATWLEQHAPLPYSETIAHHFARGGATDAAYAHYLAGAGEAVAESDRDRAERLYEALERLDVAAELHAEGALAFAEAALAWRATQRASEQLERAARFIDRCGDEPGASLRAVLARLEHDLRQLNESVSSS